MDDLISRKQAVDALNNMYQAAEKWRKRAKSDVGKARAETCMSTVSEIKMRIWKLPSAQHEPKRGKWVDDGDPLMFTCGNCGYAVMRYNNTPFCPNCGADMRGERDG